MDFKKFSGGHNFTIGSELELRILKSDLSDCANEYDYFKSSLGTKYRDNITSEFLKSMIEINTPVFSNVKDLIKYYKTIIEELNKIAKKKSLILQSSGISAIKYDSLELSKNKRYKELSNEHKILLDDFSICGLHVHIGFEDFDKSLKAFNFSLEYLPIFVALSANSVYAHGVDTGIHSYRTKIFDRLPKASLPEYFRTYESMYEVYDLLYQTDVIRSQKDIWWDVRIQSKLKTLEFRVCDALNDFDRLEVIIGLFKAICELSSLKETRYLPMQILKQNMWKASRYSMDANFIDKNRVVPIKEFIKNLINNLYDLQIINSEFKKKALEVINQNSIAKDMIASYEKNKDLKEVEKLGVFK